jgi:hypothetical protein
MAALMDFADVAHARKKRGMLSDRLVVMIAGYEMDLAVQLAQIGVGAAPSPLTEIAKMIDCVGWSDALIPTRDERLIHLCSASKRPAARADDVFVPEMGVGNSMPTTSPAQLFPAH